MKLKIQGIRGRLGTSIAEIAGKDAFIELTETAFDVALDVSSPEGTRTILNQCLASKQPLVIGTTGHNPKELQFIEEAATKIPILQMSNFSLGIEWLRKSLASLFALFGKGYIDIIEYHHHLKKDTPSGTAIHIQTMIHSLSKDSLCTIHSVRQPDLIGMHQLIMTFDQEQIEITHRALSRKAYATGAIQAVKFLYKKPPGKYTAKDLYATYSH